MNVDTRKGRTGDAGTFDEYSDENVVGGGDTFRVKDSDGEIVGFSDECAY